MLYLLVSQNNLVDEELFKQMKQISEYDPTATFSIVDRANLFAAEFWSDERVKAFARKKAVESMVNLERAYTLQSSADFIGDSSLSRSSIAG